MFAERLRALRESRAYTQEELGEFINETRLQIWRWENEKAYPDSKALTNLAKVFSVSTDFLLGLTDDWTPGFTQTDLTPGERTIIDAIRRGDKITAIEVIMARK